jgi:hypothetical protein
MSSASFAAPPALVHASCNMPPRVHDTCRSSQRNVFVMLHSPCMRVWEHIKQEVQRRGHKKAAAWLGEKCGYSAQQMTNWAGKRDIPPKEFGTIAHALGVTVDWVTSASGRAPKDEELAEVPSPAPTSPDEKRMLDALRMLRPETREAVLAFADLLPEDQDELGRPIIERPWPATG